MFFVLDTKHVEEGTLDVFNPEKRLFLRATAMIFRVKAQLSPQSQHKVSRVSSQTWSIRTQGMAWHGMAWDP